MSYREKSPIYRGRTPRILAQFILGGADAKMETNMSAAAEVQAATAVWPRNCGGLLFTDRKLTKKARDLLVAQWQSVNMVVPRE